MKGGLPMKQTTKSMMTDVTVKTVHAHEYLRFGEV